VIVKSAVQKWRGRSARALMDVKNANVALDND